MTADIHRCRRKNHSERPYKPRIRRSSAPAARSIQVFFAPALPLEEVFDPTGAGDTFAGGFIGYLAGTKDISFENMKTAIIVGSAMASFCVEKFGPTRLKEINRADIDARIRQFVDLVNFDIKLV